MLDPNIPRWIITSINKHFMDRKEDVPLYLNRYNRDSDWAELRISGPDVDEYTKDCFEFDCTVNILVTSFVDNDDYKIYRICGTFAKAFTPICCFKFGDGPDDDQTMFGTLVLQPSPQKVMIEHYGIIEPESKFRRSFLEASYIMKL